MRRFVFACLIAACAALAPTLASAGDQEIDKEIAQHIVQKLSQAQKEGQLKSFDLDLHVDKGVVWLKGYVASNEQKQFVLETAKSGKSLGLQQIVDDIEVRAVAASPTPATRPQPEQQLLAAAPTSGTSSRRQDENMPMATPVQDQQVQTVQHQQVQPEPAQPEPAQPAPVQTAAVQPTPVQPAPAPQVQQVQLQQYQPPQQAQVAPARQMARPVAVPRASTPLASAPATYGAYQGMPQGVPQGGAPAYIPASQSQPPGAYYDQPSMPGYAWPSYAAHPNYSAVTYPTQYSPTAWPYIGPFYPYPQVPLGWRKVTMEWDDGWWYLDFCER